MTTACGEGIKDSHDKMLDAARMALSPLDILEVDLPDNHVDSDQPEKPWNPRMSPDW